MTDDYPINPERPRLTTNTTTVPLGMILIRYGIATIYPSPHSNTINPDKFKQFKLVVALSSSFPNQHDSSRIITVLLQFMPVHHDGAMVLVRFMPMLPDLTNWGES